MASIKAERARLLDGLRLYSTGTVLTVGPSSRLSISHNKGHLRYICILQDPEQLRVMSLLDGYMTYHYVTFRLQSQPQSH